jgi:solute carrier family 8 (sodium/calcium exchanger)
MLNVPGTSLMGKGTLGTFYLIFLFWLFLGISVIADIFMEAIEVITSSTRDMPFADKDGNVVTVPVPVWNPTIANLTLMALGSSAPEILLSVIEALKNLGQKAGELGPSSIVGSGAFNLLVISGVSIVSVDEPKKIYDLGVYSCTAFFSIFAYSWMYICLVVTTPDEIDLTEAWLTFFFFFLLVSMAFGFDKLQ